jgi:HicB family
MNLTPYISNLQDGLVTAAAAGDEGTRRTAELLTAAVEPTARLELMHALADLAAEATAALSDRVVEIVLEGSEPVVRVLGAVEPPRGDLVGGDGGDTSRITLRLPEELKARAERAAAAEGTSLNAWLTRVVAEAIRPDTRSRSISAPRSGHRIRGWVQG